MNHEPQKNSVSTCTWDCILSKTVNCGHEDGNTHQTVSAGCSSYIRIRWCKLLGRWSQLNQDCLQSAEPPSSRVYVISMAIYINLGYIPQPKQPKTVNLIQIAALLQDLMPQSAKNRRRNTDHFHSVIASKTFTQTRSAMEWICYDMTPSW